MPQFRLLTQGGHKTRSVELKFANLKDELDAYLIKVVEDCVLLTYSMTGFTPNLNVNVICRLCFFIPSDL